VGGFLELLASVNGGNYDGNIFRGDIGGVLWKRYRTIGVRCGYAYEVPEIAVEPEREQLAFRDPKTN
jgi:hypothetical protein